MISFFIQFLIHFTKGALRNSNRFIQVHILNGI
jgi:hypothetical protein